eukprot:g91.t1
MALCAGVSRNYYLESYRDFERKYRAQEGQTSHSKLGRSLMSKQFIAEVMNNVNSRKQMWDNYDPTERGYMSADHFRLLVEHIMALDETTQVLQQEHPDTIFHESGQAVGEGGEVEKVYDYNIVEYQKKEKKYRKKVETIDAAKLTKKIMRRIATKEKGKVLREEFVDNFRADVYRQSVGMRDQLPTQHLR